MSECYQTVSICLSPAEYDQVLAAMQDAGFSSLESYVYSVLVQHQDF